MLREGQIYAIDGVVNLTQRDSIVDNFKNTDKSAVLIITSVGATGLNLQEADILIILVSIDQTTAIL